MANTVQNYPRYGDVPIVGRARITAANTARDGSGTLNTLFTAAGNGARIDRIINTSAQLAAAASSAMVHRVFVSDDAGANPRLRAEKAIATATPSTTAVGAQSEIVFPGGLLLKSGQIVYVTQSVYVGVQDQFDVIAEGESY